jgi:hypothetical protein
MTSGNEDLAQAGMRVFEDSSFAQRILENKEDHPRLRDAILADLAEAHDADVDVFLETADPARNPQVLLDYIERGPKPGGMHVQDLIDHAQHW